MKDELVDILDEQANTTGQTMLKSEAHKKSLRHSGAHVWIYNSKGEILLQLRHKTKVIRPNVWDVSAAGHNMAGDKPKQTIVREAKEELNLDINPDELEFIGIKQVDEPLPDGTVHRVFNWTYLLPLDLDINALKLEADEVSDIRWLPVEDFAKELKNPEKSKKYTPSRLELYEEVVEIVQEKMRHR